MHSTEMESIHSVARIAPALQSPSPSQSVGVGLWLCAAPGTEVVARERAARRREVRPLKYEERKQAVADCINSPL